MPQFQYTALNQSGKKLSGIIGADSKEEAHKQLNGLGISVLSLQEGNVAATAPSSTPSSDLVSFEFEAFDPNGRKIVGTIPAQSRYKAFKRLRDEYKFEVSYVVNQGASDADKEKAKLEDLSALKAQYESELKGEVVEESTEDSNFELRRKDLLIKVDEILEKIRSILKEFESEISPENKKIIQESLDKLLRIKSSTNLDYIEHTSEELLKKIQDQELFLHKERLSQKQDKLRFETQKLMANLRAKPSTSKDWTEDLRDIKEKLNKKQQAGFLSNALSRIINQLLPDPRIQELRSQIRAVNRQIWTLFRLWMQAQSSMKNEAWQSLSAVREEKKRLKQKIFEIKLEAKLEKNRQGESVQEEPILLDELTQFLGFLLSFYLIAYFLGYYALSKGISLNFIGGFNLLESPFLRNLLISLLLWYCLLTLRIQILRYQALATTLTLFLGILLNASLLFNL